MEKLPLSPSILEERIGYKYKNRQLLIDALTHSSFANEMKPKGETVVFNERLEFLGASVLSINVSDYLYRQYPDTPEGDLTRIRAALVCEESLHEVAQSLDLGSYLKLGRGEESGGGRPRPSILADATESVFAAVYLDGGLEQARTIIHRVLLDKEREEVVEERRRDYKTALQELVQRPPGHTITYHLVWETGPDHCRVFVMEVRVDGKAAGQGEGRSKKNAEQAAACSALTALTKE